MPIFFGWAGDSVMYGDAECAQATCEAFDSGSIAADAECAQALCTGLSPGAFKTCDSEECEAEAECYEAGAIKYVPVGVAVCVAAGLIPGSIKATTLQCASAIAVGLNSHTLFIAECDAAAQATCEAFDTTGATAMFGDCTGPAVAFVYAGNPEKNQVELPEILHQLLETKLESLEDALDWVDLFRSIIADPDQLTADVFAYLDLYGDGELTVEEMWAWLHWVLLRDAPRDVDGRLAWAVSDPDTFDESDPLGLCDDDTAGIVLVDGRNTNARYVGVNASGERNKVWDNVARSGAHLGYLFGGAIDDPNSNVYFAGVKDTAVPWGDIYSLRTFGATNIRRWRKDGSPARFLIRGGRHVQADATSINQNYSGTAAERVAWFAYPGEQVIWEMGSAQSAGVWSTTVMLQFNVPDMWIRNVWWKGKRELPDGTFVFAGVNGMLHASGLAPRWRALGCKLTDFRCIAPDDPNADRYPWYVDQGWSPRTGSTVNDSIRGLLLGGEDQEFGHFFMSKANDDFPLDPSHGGEGIDMVGVGNWIHHGKAVGPFPHQIIRVLASSGNTVENWIIEYCDLSNSDHKCVGIFAVLGSINRFGKFRYNRVHDWCTLEVQTGGGIQVEGTQDCEYYGNVIWQGDQALGEDACYGLVLSADGHYVDDPNESAYLLRNRAWSNVSYRAGMMLAYTGGDPQTGGGAPDKIEDNVLEENLVVGVTPSHNGDPDRDAPFFFEMGDRDANCGGNRIRNNAIGRAPGEGSTKALVEYTWSPQLATYYDVDEIEAAIAVFSGNTQAAVTFLNPEAGDFRFIGTLPFDLDPLTPLFGLPDWDAMPLFYGVEPNPSSSSGSSGSGSSSGSESSGSGSESSSSGGSGSESSSSSSSSSSEAPVCYAERSNIEDIFGRENVRKWADLDNLGNEDDIQDRIDRGLQICCNRLDNRLRQGNYSVPLEAPYPAEVVDIVARDCGVWLYDNRGITDFNPETGDPMKVHREMVRDFHRQIRIQAIRLPYTRATSVPGTVSFDTTQ